jgi:putative ABC transport system ATP-binding protein
VGLSDGQFVEVLGGLEEGTQVITGLDNAARPPVRAPLSSNPFAPGGRDSAASADRHGAPGPDRRQARVRPGDVTVHALRGVTLAIEEGAFVAIVGASGGGKTTLMNILGLLDRATSGRYLIRGERLHHRPRPPRPPAQPEDRLRVPELQPAGAHHRAGERGAAAGLRSRTDGGPARHERARKLLEAVGLGDRAHHTPSQLSGGQQQRVAIARALVNDPELLLADEPTGNLDSRTSVEVMELLQRLNRERGITIVLITHEHDIAEYAQRVVSVRDGRVVSDVAVQSRRDAREELARLPVEAVP